jgi:hypothetical protein
MATDIFKNCLAQLICMDPDIGQVAAGGAELLAGVGVARWKAWPAIEECLLKF